MRQENDGSKNQRDGYGTTSRDRLDWISKYLELADRVMGKPMPEGPERSNEV